MKKKIFLLAVLITAGVSAAACGESGAKVEMTEVADWQNYTIVRPDTANNASIDAAVLLRTAFEEKYGAKMTLTTDWVKRGEEPPTGTKEILVGTTNRPESDEELAYFDYLVEFENDRIVITGGSGAAVADAMDWFISNCLGETVKVPTESFVHNEVYPMADVTIDGVPLSDYAVFSNVANLAEYDALRIWLAENTGSYPEREGDHLIKLEYDNTVPFTEIHMNVKDGNIMLKTSESGVKMAEVMDEFYKLVENREVDAITLDEKIDVSSEQVNMLTDAQLKKWRDETDARIKEILGTPNMDIPKNRVVYYVSPSGDDHNDGKTPETAWKTIDKMNSMPIAAGSYVCFERGAVYRGKFTAKAGVTYTAYGEGDKPKIYGSPFNGAEHGKWEEVEKNIWRFSEKIANDVGTMVMNGGEAHAIKIITTFTNDNSMLRTIGKTPFDGYQSLEKNMEFWHDLGGAVTSNSKGGYIYLYYDGGNPGEVWDQIEFNTKTNVISVGANADVTIDNLCVMYGGSHGVGAGTCKNLTVQNCEFGWIGGSLQHYTNGAPTRFGNAIEIYGGCDGYFVKNNYVYQCYDAGITQQIRVSEDASIPTDKIYAQKNVQYIGNVVEYCNYSIEYFLSRIPKGNMSYIKGFLIEDNLMWYSGQGFCEQRPDSSLTSSSHIKGWLGASRNRASDFVIRNNLMVYSANTLVEVVSDLYNEDGSPSTPTTSGNNYVQYIGGKFGAIAQDNATVQKYNLGIIDYIGGLSDGTDLYWFAEAPDEGTTE